MLYIRPVNSGFSKTRRNEPCPCGSGAKFKHCHGRLDGLAMDARLQAELDRTFTAAAAVAAKVQAERLSSGIKYPRVVYHYTSEDAFKAILASGEIWLGDIFSMNDTSELLWGLNTAIEAGNLRGVHGSASARTMAAILALLPTQGVSFLKKHFMSASFSAKGDDLNQWRAYGQDGKGFAIGFHTAALIQAFRQSLPKPQPGRYVLGGCFPIAYDKDVLVRHQTSLINVFFDAVEMPSRLGILLDEHDRYYAELNEWLAHAVIEIALSFKNPSFASEAEYRLGSIANGFDVPPDSFLFHKGSKDVRYTKFNWRQAEPTAIAEVLIGPSASRREAEEVALAALRSATLPAVPIRTSGIPYRS